MVPIILRWSGRFSIKYGGNNLLITGKTFLSKFPILWNGCLAPVNVTDPYDEWVTEREEWVSKELHLAEEEKEKKFLRDLQRHSGEETDDDDSDEEQGSNDMDEDGVDKVHARNDKDK